MRRPPPPARDLDPDEVLTQYGMRRDDGMRFRRRPRFDREPPERKLSLIAGQLTAAAAAVFVRGHEDDGGRDAARYTRVRTLTDKGFIVTHTPNWKNREHVSVEWPEQWDDDVDERFEECFWSGEEG